MSKPAIFLFLMILAAPALSYADDVDTATALASSYYKASLEDQRAYEKADMDSICYKDNVNYNGAACRASRAANDKLQAKANTDRDLLRLQTSFDPQYSFTHSDVKNISQDHLIALIADAKFDAQAYQESIDKCAPADLECTKNIDWWKQTIEKRNADATKWTNALKARAAIRSESQGFDDFIARGSDLQDSSWAYSKTKDEYKKSDACKGRKAKSTDCTEMLNAYEAKGQAADTALHNMVPEAGPMDLLQDQKTVPRDQLLYNLMYFNAQMRNAQVTMDDCSEPLHLRQCTDEDKKNLEHWKTAYANELKILRDRDGVAPAVAKVASPGTLAELQGKTLTLPKGHNFNLTDKGDTDLTGYKRTSDSCTATVKFTNFDNYAQMYTGDAKADQSWTVGKYIPSYSIDNKQQDAQNLCKQLDGQKIQAECLNTLKKLKPYHVPDSVVLSATDESSRMTVYSSDSSRKDQGVLECLRAQNLDGLSGAGAKQVAGDATPAPGHGTASN